MTTTTPEFLAAELEAGCFGPSMVQNELALRVKAAAELRRLAAVEAERDALVAELERKSDAIQRLWKERDQLRAELEALRGLKPEIPLRPPHNNDASYQHPALPRYGLRWNGPGEPVSVPMDDGYWTPFHMALEALEALQVDADRYRWLRDESPGAWTLQVGDLPLFKGDLDEAIDRERKG